MLENLKKTLGIAKDDTDQDDLLNLFVQFAQKRLVGKVRNLCGGTVDPTKVQFDLEYIVFEVVISRYNRIGSEGLKNHSIEGEGLTFTDDDFAGFEKDIKDYANSLSNSQKGRVRFI